MRDFGVIYTLIMTLFNAAQPGVGRVQVLGSKKLQTEEEIQQFFIGHCMKDKHDSA